MRLDNGALVTEWKGVDRASGGFLCFLAGSLGQRAQRQWAPMKEGRGVGGGKRIDCGKGSW